MRSLEHQGVTTIFGYPGGSIMPVFDALYDHQNTLNHILVRHEQGAAHAAQGFARVSGEVGVCLVTSGPGATNTITGIADAMIDSTPIVVIAGQVGTGFLGTDAFQEVDLVGITQPIAKWSYQIRRAEDVAWAIARAFYIASSGRPGPVVLDFAKNAQVGLVDYEPQGTDFIRSYVPVPKTDPWAIRQAAALINNAKRPFILVGQGVELGGAQEEVRQLIERADIPAGCTLLGLSALPSDHPLNMGMLGMHGSLANSIKTQECDVLIAVGMRFDDRITGKLSTYARQAKKIHFEIDPSEVNKNVPVDVAVLGNCKQTLAQVLEQVKPNRHTEWIDSFGEHHEREKEAVIEPEIHPADGPIKMGEVVRKVTEMTGNKAVLVTDVGQNQMMAARYFKFSEQRSIVTSGGMGTMGYSIPAAMGAKLADKKRQVVAVCGDGSFQMSMMELATMNQHHIPVKIVVLKNNYLGMVREYQHYTYKDHYSVVDLSGSPDLEKLSAAYGMDFARLENMDHAQETVDAFLREDKSMLLECLINPMDLVK